MFVGIAERDSFVREACTRESESLDEFVYSDLGMQHYYFSVLRATWAAPLT